MLRRTRQLLRDHSAAAETSLLRETFLQRLPQSMVVVLAAAEDVPLDKLAEFADRVAEYSSPSFPTIATTSTAATYGPSASAGVEARLCHIEAALDALRVSSDRSSRRTRSSCRSRAPSPPEQPAGSYCWYHHEFGSAARKCKPPCTWQQENHRDQSLAAAGDSGRRDSCLFYVVDRIPGHRFLVDTGAEVSVIPASAIHRRPSFVQ